MKTGNESSSSMGGGCCGGSKSKSQKIKNGAGIVYNKKERPDIFNGPNMNHPKVIEAKVVLLGDSGVGKSSIAQRYCKNFFSESHDVTIGGAYLQQTVSLTDGTQVKLHIWDTGGSERFRSMVSLYYRDAAAAIICYDIGDDKSFQSVHFWINEMLNNNDREDFVMALAGNKADLDPALKKVNLATGDDIAKKHKMIFEETSAKTGEGV